MGRRPGSDATANKVTHLWPHPGFDAPLAQLRTATLRGEYTVSNLWQIDSAAVIRFRADYSVTRRQLRNSSPATAGKLSKWATANNRRS